MTDRYPGYDVLSKRHSPSWNEVTRRVVDERLAIDPAQHRFLDDIRWSTLCALCDRIIPQEGQETPVPLAAMIDARLMADDTVGYRDARLPKMRTAWLRGLKAIEAEARARHGVRFTELAAEEQDKILHTVQQNDVCAPEWSGMPADLFFKDRILSDVVSAYYGHPTAWSEIGFGGPASPRGYVRMNFDRRDPWEAAEAKPGKEEEARRANERVGR